MNFTNQKLNITSTLKLKKRGWIGLNAYKGVGFIKSADGQILYDINGKWNSQLSATNK